MSASGQKKNKGGGCCPAGMDSDKSGTKCECPAGQKAKPGGAGCDDDKDKSRQGNCPDGKVLDPKEGQAADTKNPKCQIDDEKVCKKPNIPATRPEGNELDTNYKVECGKPQDDSKRPRCNSKTHYTKVYVDSDGKASEECQKTKQFSQRKKSKVQELKGKFKEKWEKSKSQREEQGKKRQEKLKSLKDKRKQLQTDAENRQKESDKNDKKKARMGKCATVTALMMGLAQNVAQKRDEVHPYDWTTDYFDEDFMASDDRLSEFPSDIDIDKISCTDDKCGDINAEAWMKAWQERAQAADLKNNWPSCTQIGKRKLHPRCPAKRSKTAIRMSVSENVSSLDNLPTSKALVSCHGDPNACTSSLQQRQLPFINIIIEVSLFATRLGVSLLSRTASSIARWAPRLANIAKNTDRLFKIAPKGKAGARSVDAMKDAFGKIAKNPNFKKCIKDGLP